MVRRSARSVVSLVLLVVVELANGYQQLCLSVESRRGDDVAPGRAKTMDRPLLSLRLASAAPLLVRPSRPAMRWAISPVLCISWPTQPPPARHGPDPCLAFWAAPRGRGVG